MHPFFAGQAGKCCHERACFCSQGELLVFCCSLIFLAHIWSIGRNKRWRALQPHSWKLWKLPVQLLQGDSVHAWIFGIHEFCFLVDMLACIHAFTHGLACMSERPGPKQSHAEKLAKCGAKPKPKAVKLATKATPTKKRKVEEASTNAQAVPTPQPKTPTTQKRKVEEASTKAPAVPTPQPKTPTTQKRKVEEASTKAPAVPTPQPKTRKVEEASAKAPAVTPPQPKTRE